MNNHIQNTVIILFILISLISCSRKFMVIESPVKQPEARKLAQSPDVALVLGGGAFHGIAHVGVIKVLEDEGIPIDLIVGTSAGSMVGALYSDNPNIDTLLPLVYNTKTKDVFDFSLFRSRAGFVSGKRLQSYLNRYLRVTNIEETEIPFVAVTTDIEKGTSIALKAGPIAPSVNASCAIPGIFEPVKMYGTTFVDGGVLDNIATDIASEYDPKIIIAVDIMSFDTVVELKNYSQIYRRAFTVAAHNHTKNRLDAADVVITPDLEGLPMMRSKDNDKIYKLGIEAANASLPEIRRIMSERKVKFKKRVTK